MQNPSDFSGAGTSAGYRFTLRARIDRKVGTLGKLASAVSETGGIIVAIDMVQPGREQVVRDITIDAADEQQQEKIADAIDRIAGIQVLTVTDRTFFVHQCGKLEVVSKRPLKTRDDLSMAYTPGVARVSKAIHEDKNRVFDLTIKGNTVAVVTDGSAVLGLGNIGPEASLPVMEGKCVLFKEFGGVDAFPIALTTQNADEIVETVKRLAPVFGAINLEDIAAPAC
ncbi:MAG TPA: NAD-dependent malic enzyme, partial [Chloroflexota bacterium]|nr:NAD-dependent malic enzyme [Chloroflexota bacterium]